MAPTGRAYRRLLDARRAVEVRLLGRGGADFFGLAGIVYDTHEDRWWPVAWYRGGALLTLLTVPHPARPTGSLGRRLRLLRCQGRPEEGVAGGP